MPGRRWFLPVPDGPSKMQGVGQNSVACIVPPCKGAVLGSVARTAPTRRDLHIRSIKQHWRMNWQKTSGYNQRSNVEAAIGRYKRLIGDALRSREDARRRSRRLTECWNSDVQSACASPNIRCTGAILTREHRMQQSRKQEPLTSVLPGGPASGWAPMEANLGNGVERNGMELIFGSRFQYARFLQVQTRHSL
jgi:hypothetical protein